MLNASFLFAALCFLGLLLFFSGLPDLKNCALPHGITACVKRPSRTLSGSLPILCITLLYSVSAFWNLGNMRSPQSFTPMEGKTAVFELESTDPVSRIVLFPGIGSGSYLLECSDDAEGWFPLDSFIQDHVAVLKWSLVTLDFPYSFRYFRIVCSSGNPWLGEIALQNVNGDNLPLITSDTCLCDEQDLVPDSANFLNSSYFDEIYHVRTAWEHLNDIWPYEISHPPLGKEIISLGILLFGMTPFGWRFCGTLSGVLMLPLMYLFVKRMLGSCRVAVLSAILLAAGFMHYVQTRIATVDSFAVLFILLMFYFMYGWLSTGSMKELALSGVFFGVGAACKWTCLYAGAGLAILWVAYWVICFVRDGKKVLQAFLKNMLFCILFFLILPAFIYYLSYLPYGKAEGVSLFSRDYTAMVLENQRFMFQYHASIVAEHPYSSRWYQWMLNLRPILYYLEYLPDGKRVSIAAFVNPMICWGGLLCVPVLLYISFQRREWTAAFLLVAYLSGLLPWVFITRLTFEYHYFASSLFLVPMLAYVFWLMENNTVHGKTFTACFCTVSAVLYICFFPVLNGLPIDNLLGSKLLGWLPSWPI